MITTPALPFAPVLTGNAFEVSGAVLFPFQALALGPAGQAVLSFGFGSGSLCNTRTYCHGWQS